MIVLASIHDRAMHKKPIYSTTYQPIGKLPRLEFLEPTERIWSMRNIWDDTQYANAYRALLHARWEDVEEWLWGLRPDEDMTLVCYCRRGANCHRLLIAKMLQKHRGDIELEIC